jgi:exodeoxyribonuclease V gamma subunit
MLLHSCADLEPLLEQVANRLRAPLIDPMAQEIIIVPVADMTNYLKRELGRRLGDHGKSNGVVANVNFLYPRELINATPDSPNGISKSPWDATRLSWSIMSLVSDTSLFSLPKSFSSAPLSSAKRAAELFDRYASHRPEMLRAWSDGHKYDVSSNGTQDWQVEIFRALTEHLSHSPQAQRSVVDIEQFVANVDRTLLPQRISVFGVQALSRAALDVIQVLDGLIDVAVYCMYAPGSVLPSSVSVGLPRAEYAQTAITHPLFSRWSAHVLESRALLDAVIPNVSLTVEPHLQRDNSLLHQFQLGVINNDNISTSLTEQKLSEVLQDGDGSIQIHACYGLRRQVEALRDALLHALNEDSTLRLRDILIVCSDVAAAAPVLNSILDPDETVGNNVPRLPINVLRGSVTRPDEVTQAFLEVLQLVTGRCSASQLLDVASLPPVRRAFSLDDKAIDLLEQWTDQLGVQFGLNAEHRKKWNISETITNGTWQVALERLMMGIAVPAESDIIGPANVVPYDAIGTSEFLTAGTLAEFLTRIESLHSALFHGSIEKPLSLSLWNDVLLSILSNFIDVAPSASESLARLRRSIREMYADASTEIDVAAERFTLRDLSLATSDYITNSVSDFWSQFESITVTDFGGMNNVPFKVIAFVGADESAFAGGRADGDDVLSNEPRVGEPQYSLRGRENFMNLLMAARSKVIITCTGADVRNNKDTPLAVPVQEFIEHLAAIISSRGSFGDHRVVARHSRHNFDIRTLQPGHVRNDKPFTFDNNSRVVWETLNTDTDEGGPDKKIHDETSVALSHDMPVIRDIQQLIKIVSNPISYYYKDILNVDIPEGPSTEEDFSKDDNFSGDGVLALTLSPLEHSSEGRRLLQLIANFEGPHVDGWLNKVIDIWQTTRPLTGLLPPGTIGQLVSEAIGEEIRKMISVLPTELRTLQGDEIDCLIDLHHTPVALRITDVANNGQVTEFVRVKFKRYTDALLLELWVELVALTIHLQGKPVIAHLSARGASSTDENPTYQYLIMKGETDSERLEHAMSAMSAITGITRVASQIPVDLFPKTSHLIAEQDFGKADAALQSDAKYDSELAWYVADQTLSDFRKKKPTKEELALLKVGSSTIANTSSRVEMYASYIWGTFNETCANKSDVRMS